MHETMDREHEQYKLMMISEGQSAPLLHTGVRCSLNLKKTENSVALETRKWKL